MNKYSEFKLVFDRCDLVADDPKAECASSENITERLNRIDVDYITLSQYYDKDNKHLRYFNDLKTISKVRMADDLSNQNYIYISK